MKDTSRGSPLHREIHPKSSPITPRLPKLAWKHRHRRVSPSKMRRVSIEGNNNNNNSKTTTTSVLKEHHSLFQPLPLLETQQVPQQISQPTNSISCNQLVIPSESCSMLLRKMKQSEQQQCEKKNNSRQKEKEEASPPLKPPPLQKRRMIQFFTLRQSAEVSHFPPGVRKSLVYVFK